MHHVKLIPFTKYFMSVVAAMLDDYESLHGGPSIEITCECQGGNTELCMKRQTPLTYIANAL